MLWKMAFQGLVGANGVELVLPDTTKEDLNTVINFLYTGQVTIQVKVRSMCYKFSKWTSTKLKVSFVSSRFQLFIWPVSENCFSLIEWKQLHLLRLASAFPPSSLQFQESFADPKKQLPRSPPPPPPPVSHTGDHPPLPLHHLHQSLHPL